MGLKTISPGELHQMIQKQQVTVIDVNSRQSWIKARVPGALNLDPADYNHSDLPPDKESSLVSYCSNPMCGERRPMRLVGQRRWVMAIVKVMSAGYQWLARR